MSDIANNVRVIERVCHIRVGERVYDKGVRNEGYDIRIVERVYHIREDHIIYDISVGNRVYDIRACEFLRRKSVWQSMT